MNTVVRVILLLTTALLQNIEITPWWGDSGYQDMLKCWWWDGKWYKHI